MLEICCNDVFQAVYNLVSRDGNKIESLNLVNLVERIFSYVLRAIAWCFLTSLLKASWSSSENGFGELAVWRVLHGLYLFNKPWDIISHYIFSPRIFSSCVFFWRSQKPTELTVTIAIVDVSGRENRPNFMRASPTSGNDTEAAQALQGAPAAKCVELSVLPFFFYCW